MTFTIRDVRTNEKLVETEYGQKNSAIRSFRSRLLTPETAYIADENWREREAARSNLINLELFGLIPKPDHFLHVSIKSTPDDFLVSYTENPLKGSKNIQASGRKIGRYLQQFHPEADANTLGHAIIAKVTGMSVTFAVTPKEIEDAYRECDSRSTISSCMTHARHNYALYNVDRNLHPVHAYGNSDLQLAYLRNKSNHISARVMVCPEKKVYSQPYGSDAHKLQGLLEKMGYTRGSFSGAKLNKIDVTAKVYGGTSGRICLVAPYIDGDRYVYLDNDDNLVIGRGANAVAVGASAGYVEFQIMTDAVTGERLTNATAVAVVHPYTNETVYVHANHLSERSVIIKGSYYALIGLDKASFWYMMDGVNMPYGYLSRHYYRSCVDESWIKPEDMVETNLGLMSIQQFVGKYAKCEITSNTERQTNMVRMEHGAWWTKKTFIKYKGVTINGKNYAAHLAGEAQ